MQPVLKILLLSALCSLSIMPQCWAQTSPHGSVSGVVTDTETGLPIAGAHAFIGSTLIGTVTDNQGGFLLNRIPAGSHSLWISMLGYEPISEEFVVNDSTRSTGLNFELALEPAILEIGEVVVTGKRDKRWKKRLKQFRKMFIGETAFSKTAIILNPEILDFDSNWVGTFVAHAPEPLIIKNHALGYRVTYVLKEFEREGTTIRYDGDPLFEELAPDYAEQQQEWESNREIAFHGSFHHFLLSLMEGITEEEGFDIMHVPTEEDIARGSRRFRIDPATLLEPAKNPEEVMLTFRGFLEITYLEEEESPNYLSWRGTTTRRASHQRSWIRLTTGPTAIDANGEVIDPYGVTVYGYYAYENMGDEVPKEYRPPGWPANNP